MGWVMGEHNVVVISLDMSLLFLFCFLLSPYPFLSFLFFLSSLFSSISLLSLPLSGIPLFISIYPQSPVPPFMYIRFGSPYALRARSPTTIAARRKSHAIETGLTAITHPLPPKHWYTFFLVILQ
ncbi:hypothetical protein HOY80DRAFT_953029 [Tuber brumale]|nr:hypothetical protein HOY80DRAFT_953029 [Tuber brumale]